MIGKTRLVRRIDARFNNNWKYMVSAPGTGQFQVVAATDLGRVGACYTDQSEEILIRVELTGHTSYLDTLQGNGWIRAVALRTILYTCSSTPAQIRSHLRAALQALKVGGELETIVNGFAPCEFVEIALELCNPLLGNLTRDYQQLEEEWEGIQGQIEELAKKQQSLEGELRRVEELRSPLLKSSLGCARSGLTFQPTIPMRGESDLNALREYDDNIYHIPGVTDRAPDTSCNGMARKSVIPLSRAGREKELKAIKGQRLAKICKQITGSGIRWGTKTGYINKILSHEYPN